MAIHNRESTNQPVQPLVLIVMGVSGSGKTTIGKQLAAELGWTFHDADDDHPPSNLAKMSRGIPLSEYDRQPWLATLSAKVRAWLDANENAVLACSALTRAARQELQAGDRRVKFVYLKGSPSLIQDRVAQRSKHFMPATLLNDQFQTLEEPIGAIEVDAAANPAAITKFIRQRLAIKTPRRDDVQH